MIVEKLVLKRNRLLFRIQNEPFTRLENIRCLRDDHGHVLTMAIDHRNELGRTRRLVDEFGHPPYFKTCSGETVDFVSVDLSGYFRFFPVL